MTPISDFFEMSEIGSRVFSDIGLPASAHCVPFRFSAEERHKKRALRIAEKLLVRLLTQCSHNEAVSVIHKVMAKNEPSMETLVSTRLPFGLPNTFKGNKVKNSPSDLLVYVSGNDREVRGSAAYVARNVISRGTEMIGWHKVYIAKAGSGSDSFPHPILPKPFYGAPDTVCNESYLVIGPFKDKQECENVMSYIATRFFRFLVLQKKNSQNAAKGVYQLVPQQDFSKPWTDAELYAKYGLSDEEIAFIESMIRPMDLTGGED